MVESPPAIVLSGGDTDSEKLVSLIVTLTVADWSQLVPVIPTWKELASLEKPASVMVLV